MRQQAPMQPNSPSLLGESLAVWSVSTNNTNMKVQIISIIKALKPVIPGFGIRKSNSESGTDPLSWFGRLAVYLFCMQVKARSEPNIAPDIYANTVSKNIGS
jgi:hypothetical protein